MTVLPLLLALTTLATAPEAADPAKPRATLAEARRIEEMIDRGQTARAKAQLSAGDFPPLVRATLQGRLAMAQDDPAQAERAFGRAIELAPDHAPLRVLLAHAQVAAGRHRAALSTLRAEGIDTEDPPVALLQAAAHRGLGDPASAYATLRRGALAHPGHAPLLRELVMLCASEGLFETARHWAERSTPSQLGPDVALIALQQARVQEGGATFARWLAAGFPDDAGVQAELGWVESGEGEYTAAARALAQASRLGADTAFAAAEHYRAARRYRDALNLNARVGDNGRRAEQRFDILFESGKMARSITAGDALEDANGLSPRRRYSLAYAHYALRQYAEATRHARQLGGTAEANRAQALLRAMGR